MTLPPDDVWDRFDAAIAERLPDAAPEVIRGQRSELPDGDSFYLEVITRRRPCTAPGAVRRAMP